MPRIIVVGAGVIGASVAFRLSESGAAVTVLDASRIGGGTSGASFAWLNSNQKPPRAYHDLNVAGMRAHSALRRELGAADWMHDGGGLEWRAEPDQPAQRTKMERLQAWGYAARWIDKRGLAALAPDLDMAAVGEAPVAFYSDEGWIDPVPYATAMLRLARDRGARLVVRAPVDCVVVRAGRAVGVRTDDGALHKADVVVNCAGAWVNRVVRDEALHIPLAPTRGLLVFTPPVPVTLSRVLHTPALNLRPDGAGRLMLHAEDVDTSIGEADATGPDLPQGRDLVRRACAVFPSIGDVAPEAVRIGIRPMPRDGVSVVGQANGVENLYVVVTHSGVTLAAFLGTAVADEILDGRQRPELAAFRPSRFARAS